jgi:hypothetical protein
VPVRPYAPQCGCTEPYIAENQTGRYVWLPITWGEGDGKPRVVWHDEWQL